MEPAEMVAFKLVPAHDEARARAEHAREKKFGRYPKMFFYRDIFLPCYSFCQ